MQLRAVSQGRRLEIATIVWAALETALGLWSAWQAHALSLAAFGFGSLIEFGSAAALLWRLQHEHDPVRRERAEQRSLRIAAIGLLLLAACTLGEAVQHLFSGAEAEPSGLGLFITASAVVLMPLLARGKRRVAARLDSDAMLTDSRQADVCALQALIVLLGIAALRRLQIRNADAIASLLLVPLIVREGIRGLQGQSCGCASNQCSRVG